MKTCSVLISLIFALLFLSCIPMIVFPEDEIITGKGAGPGSDALVRYFSAEGKSWLEFTAYSYKNYGVNLSAGNLDGEGFHEILIAPGPGPGFGPVISCFRANSTRICSFLAYGSRSWGAQVACGDVDGDGRDEIITAPGPGPALGGHIRGFNFENGRIVPININALLGCKYGATIACADVDGDLMDEIITAPGAGPGQGPHIRGWDFDGISIIPIPWINFLAFGTPGFGANLSAGDIDSNSRDELLAAPGPRPAYGSFLRAFSTSNNTVHHLFTFKPYPVGKFGCRIACGNMDDDAYEEMITGPGPGRKYGSHIRGFNYDDESVSSMTSPNFIAYSGSEYGVNVAGGIWIQHPMILSISEHWVETRAQDSA